MERRKRFRPSVGRWRKIRSVVAQTGAGKRARARFGVPGTISVRPVHREGANAYPRFRESLASARSGSVSFSQNNRAKGPTKWQRRERNGGGPWFEGKFSLRRRAATMCPPSENIEKRRTAKLSARRPRSRANETSSRYTVNTGSDDDVEAALQEAVTSPVIARSLFFSSPFLRLQRGSSIFVAGYAHREIRDNSHLCDAAYRPRSATRSTVCRYEFIRRVPGGKGRGGGGKPVEKRKEKRRGGWSAGRGRSTADAG